MKTLRTLAITLALGAIAFPALAQMNAAPPVPMTPAQFSHAAAGDSVQIAVRVKQAERSTLDTELLERITDSRNRATGTHVQIFFPDGTPVIMGAASDVKPGAVLFVYGIVTKAGHVDAKRVVVDTKYVTVQ